MLKDINIKNRSYYFFNDRIALKSFNKADLKVVKKNYRHIDIYYIGYIMIKKIDDYENIHSVNPLYLIIHSATGNFERKGKNEYLINKIF